MIRVLFAGNPAGWDRYRPALEAAFAAAGLGVALSPDHAPATVDWIIHSPAGPIADFTPFTRAKGVLSLWAGVEGVVANPTLHLPLARMVDPSLTEGMVEWVLAHVLRHHLGTDAHVVNPDRVWASDPPPLARDRRVGVLGLGELGAACATALAGLRFDVAGWSRGAKVVPGIACHHGPDGLRVVLARSEIVVLLLPSTPATANVIDAAALNLLPHGAVVVNPGRGPLIDDDALLAALDDGRIGHATLDVFRTEPLPQDHCYWTHPRVTVTPHVASATRPGTASRVIADNVRRGEAGQPLLHMVDRTAGY